jgi:hypothetical protein
MCIGGACICTVQGAANMTTVGLWAASIVGGALSVCLQVDIAAAVGEPTGYNGSPGVKISSGELTLDCAKPDLCTMLDRIYIEQGTVSLNRLRYADFDTSSGSSGVLYVKNGVANALTVLGCTFERITGGGTGGAIWVGSSTTLTIFRSTFQSCQAGGDGGAIFAQRAATVTIAHCSFSSNRAEGAAGAFTVGGTVTISYCSFASNTNGYNGYGPAASILHGSSRQEYSDAAMNAAFGGAAG